MIHPGLTGTPIAHRGLWRPDGPPENSLEAITAAVDAGYAVEFDVRLTGDGEAVVFHDETLERMCGDPERLDARSLEELQACRLAGRDFRIPSLAEVLRAVDGRQMLLVELKETHPVGALEARVAELLDGYGGPVAVISFQAPMLAWFADHRPHLPRGLDEAGASDEELARSEFDLAHIFEGKVQLARPHFLVLAKDMAGGSIAREHRARGLPLIAWTVRDQAEAEAAAPHIDNYIFEGFTPGAGQKLT